MATSAEQTLQLRDFMGISRNLNSPNQPPNKLYTCQNMYAPTKGELALVGGVTDVSGSGLPGVSSIKGTSFLKTAVGYERALVFFDHAAIPTPSAPTAVAVAGTAFTGSVYLAITYVGMGGESDLSAITTVACGAGSSIQVTIPSLPTGVVGVNIFYGTTLLTGAIPNKLIATVSQRAGVIPSTVTLTKGTSTQGDGFYNAVFVDQFKVTFSTGGTLTPGRTYYFGLAPATGASNIAMVTTATGVPAIGGYTMPSGLAFAFTVPEGMSKATLSFNSQTRLYKDPSNSDKWAALITSAGNTSNLWLFVGTTPEDLTAVSGTTNGFIQPYLYNDTFEISEVPYNSNFSSFKMGARTSAADYSDPRGFITLICCNAAGANSVTNDPYWIFENTSGVSFGVQGTPYLSNGVSGLGIWALQGTTFNSATDYQIIPTRGCGRFSKNTTLNGGVAGTGTGQSTSVFMPFSGGQLVVSEGNGLRESAYVNRLYFANGIQSPFYTNGYVLNQVARKANTPYLPITNEIAVFKDRLVLGGGSGSLFNTQNVVYYSATADFGTFTATPGATAGLQYISAIEADSDEIVGFGSYSESVNQFGNLAYLVIGKNERTYTWDGNTANGAQVIAARTGFASARCFVVTPWGPIFVGKENVYKMTRGGQAEAIGDDVRAILKGISATNLPYLTALFHDSHLKIGYRETANIDRELWLDIRQENGMSMTVFTGPHVMKAYDGHASAVTFAGSREVRLSYLSNKIYRRDNLSSYLNDGSTIAVSLESNDLALGADEFVKLLTRFYMRAKIKRQESVSLSVKFYDNKEIGQGLDYATDGADQTFSDSMTLPFAGSGTIYRLFQKMFATRYRGSILRFTLSLSTNEDFRVQAMSWLFNIHRRRLL